MKFTRFVELELYKKEMLTEASYGTANMEKVAKLFASYLSKRFGQLYPFGGYSDYSETYTKTNGNSGVGYRFYSDDGQAVRIDFDATNNGQLSGITYWKDLADEPTRYIEIPNGLNSIQSAELIVKSILDTGSTANFQKAMQEAIDEAFIDTKGLDPSLLTPKGKLKKQAEKLAADFGVDLRGKTMKELQKLAKQVTTMTAGKEKTSRAKDTAEAQAALDKKPLADEDTVFDELADLVRTLCTTNQPSLLVTGMAGIGKTYTITTMIKSYLGEPGKKWIKFAGKASAPALYETLFLHHDELIVFDDCDSVFKDADAVNLLKAALDSYDVRQISWVSKVTRDCTTMDPSERHAYFEEVRAMLRSEGSLAGTGLKMPNQFDFTGKICFISNIPAAKLDDAVKSRSITCDIMLSRQGVFKRIESILPAIEPTVPLKYKMEVLEVLKTTQQQAKEVSMRNVILAIRIRQGGSPNWKTLVRKYG